MKYYFSVLLFLLIYLLNGIYGNYQCTIHQLHFQKILGYRPLIEPTTINTHNLLYNENQNYQHGNIPSVSNKKCWEFCKQDYDCSGYMLIFKTGECFGFTINVRSKNYYLLTNTTLVQDPNVVYFEKFCLKNVPDICKNNLWVITKIPGSNLIFQGKKTLSNLVTRSNCTEQCLNEKEFKCLSASFIRSHRNNYIRNNYDQIDNQNLFGTCILNPKDKSMQPDAFRITNTNDDEYIENQCIERVTENEKCSYEVYVNSMLEYAEIQYNGLTQNQCKEKCSAQRQFYCQGISYYDPKKGLKYTQCYLHSEDIVSLGPNSLITRDNFLYMKRVKCLNVTVQCTQNEMIVNYTPQDWFLGRMYVNSHSEVCSSQGKGSNEVFLRLPIGNEVRERRCGLIRAYEYNKAFHSNRTLISTLLVIQTNPIVQTHGDRLIKVGCVYNNNMNDTIIDDIPLESSIEFTNRTTISNMGSILINTTDSLPNVYMQIINLDELTRTNDVSLGQNLELQIIVDPPNSMYDVRAVQLIARSDTGHQSILLLDKRGCPTDLTIFPALEKYHTDKLHLLNGRFRAFKFTGSSFVNFDVMIHFCLNQCPTIQCNRNVISYGKKRRRRHIFVPKSQRIVNNQIQPIKFPDDQPHLDQFHIRTLRPIVFPLDTIKFDDKTEGNGNHLRFVRTIIGNTEYDKTSEHMENNEISDIISQRIINVQHYPQTTMMITADDEDEETANIKETQRLVTNSSRILKNLPLQIKLNVREPYLGERESLIYSENNQILVAGIEAPIMDSNSICVNQTLLIFLILITILILICIVLFSCVWIRKYKRLADMNGDSTDSINDMHQRLDYDSRKVQWADQGRSHVIIYA